MWADTLLASAPVAGTAPEKDADINANAKGSLEGRAAGLSVRTATQRRARSELRVRKAYPTIDTGRMTSELECIPLTAHN